MRVVAIRNLVFLSLAVATAAHGDIPSSERNALIAFYNSTGGSGWTDHMRWLGAAGTECAPTPWFGVVCDGIGSHVAGIVLPNNNLTGTLPALTLLRLSSDHFGDFAEAIDGVNTVETQMADNDHALGMVVERRRPPGEPEHVIFYCENCEALVEDIHFDCGDIVQHFSQAMLDFWNDDARRTCKNCGKKVEQPEPTKPF